MPDSDYYFDEGVADAAVAFFRDNLRHTKGEWRGRPFILTESQANDVIRPLFGTMRKSDDTRRYRKCVVWEPRKNGKTELAAGVAHLCLLGDADEGAGEGYAIARDEKQARIVFDIATQMVALSPQLEPLITPFKTSLLCSALSSTFQPLSGAAAGKHGLNMSFLIGDEVHEWESDRLYQFVHQSSGARRQPLEFLISTAGVKGSYGEELYNHCVKVRDGIIDDPELLVVIYAADAEDDWRDEATWYKANPNLGVTIKIDYLRAEFQKARESVRLENDFKRYHLNMWTEQAVRWIPVDIWDESSAATKEAPTWPDLEQRLTSLECFGGLDLSATTDITALVWVFPVQDGLDRVHVLCRFWVPEDKVAQHERKTRKPYSQWIRDGAMFTTPGDVIEYPFIKDQIYRDAETFVVQDIAYDPWNAQQLTNEMMADGMPLTKFRQGIPSYAAPSKDFERLVLSRKIEHGMHPVLRWMVSNVATRMDTNQNFMPAKEKSSGKIDGVSAMVMAIGVMNAMQGDDDEVTQGVVYV